MRELTEKLDGLMGRGQWDEAEALLLSARDRAIERGDEATALSVESERMGFYRMHDQPEGFFAAKESALSLLEKVRIDRRARGTILINAATGLVAFGRAEEALPLYTETETLYTAVLRPGDYLFAALYNNMASAFAALGDYEKAVGQTCRALAILEKLPHHPDLATTWVNLAQLYAAFDKGADKVAEALDHARAAFDDPEMKWDGYYAHTAQKCAGAFAALGRAEDAAELRERVELIYAGT